MSGGDGEVSHVLLTLGTSVRQARQAGQRAVLCPYKI